MESFSNTTTDISRSSFHTAGYSRYGEVSLTQGRRSQTPIIDSWARHYVRIALFLAHLSGLRNRVSFFRTIMETFLRLGIPVLQRNTFARSCAFQSALVFLFLSFSSCRRQFTVCYCEIAIRKLSHAKKKFIPLGKSLNDRKKKDDVDAIRRISWDYAYFFPNWLLMSLFSFSR